MNLSKKIMCLKHRECYEEKCGEWVFRKRDVIDFIKELKLRCSSGTCGIIDELVGEKLAGETK